MLLEKLLSKNRYLISNNNTNIPFQVYRKYLLCHIQNKKICYSSIKHHSCSVILSSRTKIGKAQEQMRYTCYYSNLLQKDLSGLKSVKDDLSSSKQHLSEAASLMCLICVSSICFTGGLELVLSWKLIISFTKMMKIIYVIYSLIRNVKKKRIGMF